MAMMRKKSGSDSGSGKVRPPEQSAKDGEVIPPSSGPRLPMGLSIGDVVALAQEATAFMREASSYLAERERTKQADIDARNELQRIEAELQKTKSEHDREIIRLGQDEKIVNEILAQLAGLREGVSPMLSNIASLDHSRVETLMRILDTITTLQRNLLEQCRR